MLQDAANNEFVIKNQINEIHDNDESCVSENV